MKEATPIEFSWDGKAMTPASQYWARLADKHYVVGETYPLEVRYDRSHNSHSHYFAMVTEGWRNLPEDQAERFPTSEHLRKWALIKAGHHDSRSIVAASKAEAQRVAAFVRPMDEFAVVLVFEAVVTVYTAKSQSMRAMGRKEFQASKDAVLNIISGMIGITPGALEHNAGQAA